MNNLIVSMENNPLQAKKEYFRAGNTLPLSFRSKALKTLKSCIKTNETAIMEALALDLGKSAFEAYATEIGVVYEEIGLHLRKLKRWSARHFVDSPITAFPARSYYQYEPYGVTLIVAPWNYPFQLVMVPLVSAIAAGNCAVIKPSELSTYTSALLQKMIQSCFDLSFIEVILGDADVSKDLLRQPFDMIFFTGSPRVGKLVMHAAADHLIPLVLELGGKSPCIVDETASVPLAARRIVWGKLINSGQTCIAPDYLLVDEKVKEDLVKAIRLEIRQMFGENPLESPDYPRIIDEKAYNRLKNYLAQGKLLSGGRFNDEQRYLEPVLIEPDSLDSEVMQEEIFGPVLPVVCFKNLEEAIQIVQSRPKPLALYLFTKSRKNTRAVLQKTSSGGVTLNDTLMHFANNNLPFGGVGNSGTGSYHGLAGFEAFSHRKPVLRRSLWPDIPLRYAPFAKKLPLIRLIMR